MRNGITGVSAALALLLSALASADSCRAYEFKADLQQPDSWQLQASGLLFRLQSQENNSGWVFDVVSVNKPDGVDLMRALTPPWRGWHPSMLDTEYGMLAEDAVYREPRRFWFMSDASRVEALGHTVDQLLWPGNEGDPEAAEEDAYNELLRYPRGYIELTVLNATVKPAVETPEDSDTEADPGEVLALQARLRLIVDEDFEIPGKIGTRTDCQPYEPD
jgi:hypothetical protein